MGEILRGAVRKVRSEIKTLPSIQTESPRGKSKKDLQEDIYRRSSSIYDAAIAIAGDQPRVNGSRLIVSGEIGQTEITGIVQVRIFTSIKLDEANKRVTEVTTHAIPFALNPDVTKDRERSGALVDPNDPKVIYEPMGNEVFGVVVARETFENTDLTRTQLKRKSRTLKDIERQVISLAGSTMIGEENKKMPPNYVDRGRSDRGDRSVEDGTHFDNADFAKKKIFEQSVIDNNESLVQTGIRDLVVVPYLEKNNVVFRKLLKRDDLLNHVFVGVGFNEESKGAKGETEIGDPLQLIAVIPNPEFLEYKPDPDFASYDGLPKPQPFITRTFRLDTMNRLVCDNFAVQLEPDQLASLIKQATIAKDNGFGSLSVATVLSAMANKPDERLQDTIQFERAWISQVATKAVTSFGRRNGYPQSSVLTVDDGSVITRLRLYPKHRIGGKSTRHDSERLSQVILGADGKAIEWQLFENHLNSRGRQLEELDRLDEMREWVESASLISKSGPRRARAKVS